MSMVPRYTPNASKALEVILWLAKEEPGIDIYHLVKAAFFADKVHITNYGRPIVGDEYRSAWWGPLPQVIYGLLNHSPIEMIAVESNGYLPFKVDRANRVTPERDPNCRLLSETDVEALRSGLTHVSGRTFNELYEETHADPAYYRAPQNGQMDYRQFIADDDPDRDEKRKYVEELAPYAAF